MDFDIVKFFREVGYDNNIFFTYEGEADRSRWLEFQKRTDKDQLLLKKVDDLIHKDAEIQRNEKGHYVVIGDALKRILSQARIELEKEREERRMEREKNKEKNRKLAQASYDIFAADRKENRNLGF